MLNKCEGLVYTINKDDTLYKIGQKYNVSVKALMRANPYVDVYNLQVGEEICIPNTKTYESKKPIFGIKQKNKTKPYVILINCTLAQLLDELKINHEELVKYNTSLPETFMPGMVINVPIK